MPKIRLKNIKAELIRHEGLRLKPYLCSAGKLTLGIGRNLEDRGISAEEAEFLLENDLENFQAGLAEQLPWSLELPGEAQEVLLNMAFNLGLQGLLGFSKMLAALKAHQWRQAAKEMLDSRWATQVGPRAEELARKVEQLEYQNRQSLELLADIKQQIKWIEQRMESSC